MANLLFGRFRFGSNTYEFGGRYYTPKWNADPYKFPIAQVKQTLETAYSASGEKSAKGILVVTKAKWEEIKKSYNSWVDMAQFHYVDYTINAGEIPTWMNEAAGYNHALIHEYKDGMVVYRGDPALIYKCFLDAEPWFDDPETPPSPPSPPPHTEPGPLVGNHFRGTITSKRYLIGIPIGKTVHEVDVWLDQEVEQ